MYFSKCFDVHIGGMREQKIPDEGGEERDLIRAHSHLPLLQTQHQDSYYSHCNRCVCVRVCACACACVCVKEDVMHHPDVTFQSMADALCAKTAIYTLT